MNEAEQPAVLGDGERRASISAANRSSPTIVTRTSTPGMRCCRMTGAHRSPGIAAAPRRPEGAFDPAPYEAKKLALKGKLLNVLITDEDTATRLLPKSPLRGE